MLIGEWEVIFHHLNQLNNELQGRDKIVMQLEEKLCAYKKSSYFFMLIFDLEKCSISLHCTKQVKVMGLIEALKTNFATRFDNFSIPLMGGNLLRTFSV